MEDIISFFIEAGMGSVIDKRKDPLLLADKKYKKLCSELNKTETAYNKLELEKEDAETIKEYMFCMEKLRSRENDLCYIAGIKDGILFLNQLGLIGKNEDKK